MALNFVVEAVAITALNRFQCCHVLTFKNFYKNKVLLFVMFVMIIDSKTLVLVLHHFYMIK